MTMDWQGAPGSPSSYTVKRILRLEIPVDSYPNVSTQGFYSLLCVCSTTDALMLIFLNFHSYFLCLISSILLDDFSALEATL